MDATDRPFERWLPWLLAAGLVALTGTAFWGVKDLGFVNYDDGEYVYNNPHVRAGLSMAGLRWAGGVFFANWQPVTLVTYLVDYQIAGLHPRVYHVSNLVYHAVAVVLLFLVLRRMTGALWPSAFVAAVFAIHPLRVESVAWVSSRKDVVSGIFWMLTLLAYLRYRERPGAARYAAVCASFALGLLAKPMLVTLPCVLLLLDYWPLRRTNGLSVWALVRDKLPLFAMAVVFSGITLVIQQRAGAAPALEHLPLGLRIGNALASYPAYLGKLFWPSGLAVFYPHPGRSLSLIAIGLSGVILAGTTLFVFGLRREYPYLLVGWLWFVGTLVPVIGVVQVGSQAMADRYTYIPLIGLTIAVAWGAAAAVQGQARWAAGAALAAAAVLAVLTGLTWRQVGYWRDETALWQHTVAVTAGNYPAQYNLGSALLRRGQYDAALGHLEEALRLKPDDVKATTNLGVALLRKGDAAGAMERLKGALRQAPDDVDALVNLGVAEAQTGALQEAAKHLARAVELDRDSEDAQVNLAIASEQLGNLGDAERALREALRIRPDDADARRRLDNVLRRQGRAP